jgi:LysR family hca operon transcriptional activator
VTQNFLPPLPAYPTSRLRRNRRDAWSRKLVAENMLSAGDLIWPVFVHDESDRAPVDTMPGAFRHSIASLVDAAGEAARRAAYPAKASFVMGFLTGIEMEWLPEAVRILHDELPNIEVIISSQHSPEIADALLKGKVDVGFLRPEKEMRDLVYTVLTTEPMVMVLPSDHRLAALKAISLRDIEGETFIAVSRTAPTLRAIIDDYINRSGVNITPHHEADHMYMAMSLVASTRGVALLPLYVRNFLPWSVISRPLEGTAPTIDLVLGYHKANTSPLLKLFLSRVDELVARVSKRSGELGDLPAERVH